MHKKHFGRVDCSGRTPETLIPFYANEVRDMTAKKRLMQKRFAPESFTPGQICFGLFALFCLLLILRNTAIAIEYMSRGLSLCAKTVIPSLFPFMVISELIVSGNVAARLFNKPSIPLQKLLHLSSDGACAFLLGILCGFPIGARCAVQSYRLGRISREECERILCFSSTPSSAFLITAVGESLWGNRKFGIALYLASILSSLVIGMFIARFPKKAPQASPIFHGEPLTSPRISSSKLFCDAILSATKSILLVCAYVLFFSALVGTFHFMPGVQKLPTAAKAFLFCLFELSSGVGAATALSVPMQAALLCAFAVGWSGISVHCQLLSICESERLSLKPYVIAKLCQSMILPLILAAILFLFPNLLIPAIGI